MYKLIVSIIIRIASNKSDSPFQRTTPLSKEPNIRPGKDISSVLGLGGIPIPNYEVLKFRTTVAPKAGTPLWPPKHI